MRRFARWQAALALCLAAFSPWAAATVSEIEPNNSCATAQNIGTGPGASVSGAIAQGDVDYFVIHATPGTLLQADLSGQTGGGGDIADTLLGIFDSSCAQIGYNDYGGADMDSRVVFKVPADGTVIIAAAGYPDFGFTGNAFVLGTYTLTVHAPTSAYVAGTLTDAASGQPLPAGAAAAVTLLHCPSVGYDICSDEVSTNPVAADGSYVVSLTGLDAGYYQLRSAPTNYGYSYSAPFQLSDASSGIPLDLSAKALPITIGAISDCTRTRRDGDCTYTMTVTNVGNAALDADIWTSVQATPTGAPYGSAAFTTGSRPYVPNHVNLAAGASTVVTQVLPIAATPTGVQGLADVYASVTRQPLATIGHAAFGFTVASSGAPISSTVVPSRVRQANRQHADRRPVVTASATAQRTAHIAGTVLNADTGLPVTQPFAPFVNLYVCAQSDDALCTIYLGGTQAADDGSYTMDARKLARGRYQLWASMSGYDLGYSRTFAYVGQALPSIDLTIAPKHVVLTNITVCGTDFQWPAGTDCTYSYDLTNSGTTARTLEAWVGVQVQPTGSVVNATTFARPTDGGAVRTLITLQPGETRTISKPLPLMTSVPAGASYFPSIWISTPGHPFDIQTFDLVPTVTVIPSAAAAAVVAR